MPIYTIRDDVTGRSYDINWPNPIESYSAEDFQREINAQEAARQAAAQEVNARVAAASAVPRGSMERAALMTPQPVPADPSMTAGIAAAAGQAMSRFAPSMLRSAMLVNQSLGPPAAVRYPVETMARMASGVAPENPLRAIARYAAATSRTPLYQQVKAAEDEMAAYYEPAFENMTPEQRQVAETFGGGVGSALNYAASIPLGAMGLVPTAAGQTLAPSLEKYLAMGATPEQAAAQAAVEGATEVGSEMVLGVPGKIARGLGLAPALTRLTAPVRRLVDPLVKSALGELGISAAQEGVEEMISGITDDLSAAYLTGADPNALQGGIQRRLQEFAGGAIGGAVLTPAARQARGIAERNKRIAEKAQQIAALRQQIGQLQQQLGQPAALPRGQASPVPPVIKATPPGQLPRPIEMAGPPLPLLPGEQDLPYDFLTQLAREQQAAANMPPGMTEMAGPPGPVAQDLPYDLLSQFRTDVPPSSPSTATAPTQAPVATPVAQPVPGVLRSKPRSQKKTQQQPVLRIPDTYPEDEEALAAEALRQEQLGISSGQTLSKLRQKGRKKKGGSNAEVQGKEEVTAAVPTEQPSTGAAEQAAPPLSPEPPVLPTAPEPAPTQQQLEEERAAAEQPPVIIGLDQVPNIEAYVRLFRLQAKQLAKHPNKAEREKMLGDLIAEHQRARRKFETRRKVMENLEVEAARIFASDPASSRQMMKLAIADDLIDRQRKWLDEHLDEIGDIPGPNSTQKEIEDYERRAIVPPGQRVVARSSIENALTMPAPWRRPDIWLRDFVSAGHSKHEKRQRTTRHAVVRIDGSIFVVPVYDQGSGNNPGSRLYIGDPFTYGEGRAKNRLAADAWALKYQDRAELLGTIRFPTNAAQEWVQQWSMTQEDFDLLFSELEKLQSDTITSYLYPTGEITETGELSGISEQDFLEELSAKEPAMAHISDFVDSLVGDFLPVFSNETDVGRWAIRAFEHWINTNGDARQLMDRVIEIMMRSAVVRQTKSGVQGISGLPIKYANNEYQAKRWFKQQIAEAVIEATRNAKDWARANVGAVIEQIKARAAGQPTPRRELALPRVKPSIAAALARRIAPAITQAPAKPGAGVRPSEIGDYGVTGVTHTRQEGGLQGRQRTTAQRLAAMRKRVANLPTELRQRMTPVPPEPPPLGASLKLRRLKKGAHVPSIKRKQVSPPFEPKERPKIEQTKIDKTAPPLVWREHVDSKGQTYWTARSTEAFREWVTNTADAQHIFDFTKPGGNITPTVKTYQNPQNFSAGPVEWATARRKPKSRSRAAATVPGAKGAMIPRSGPVMPENATEEQAKEYVRQLMVYKAAEAARSLNEATEEEQQGEASGVQPVAKLFRLWARKKFFVDGGTRTALDSPDGIPGWHWAWRLEEFLSAHPELTDAQRAATQRIIDGIGSDVRRWTIDGISNAMGWSAANRFDEFENEELRNVLMSGAANPELPSEDQGRANGESLVSSMRKLGVDRWKVDSSIDGPMAVSVSSDGSITVHINPEKSNNISQSAYDAIVDEEVRHAALYAFMRQQLRDSGFLGDYAIEIDRQLRELWQSVDQPTRIALEAGTSVVYGRRLGTPNLVAEIIRMSGQRKVTEGTTRTGLGQRFLDFVAKFKQWLDQLFEKKLPRGLVELRDGAERLLAMASRGEYLGSYWEGGVAIPEAPSELVAGAAPEVRLKEQRLTEERVRDYTTSGNLGPLGQRRLMEREAAQADLVSGQTRADVAALATTATTPIPKGLDEWARRQAQDDRRVANFAHAALRPIRDLLGLQDRQPAGTQSAYQRVRYGTADFRRLDDKTRAEVLHDSAGVVAQHEAMEFQRETLERTHESLLIAEAKALNDLRNLLGSVSDPLSMRKFLNDRLTQFRNDVSEAFALSELLDARAASGVAGLNLSVEELSNKINAALGVLGTRGAVSDLQELFNALASHPALADLALQSGWPIDPDLFYDELVNRGILGGAIASSPTLSASAAIHNAITAPAPGVRPPLKAYGQIRRLVESLQGYEQERARAMAALAALQPVVDPLLDLTKSTRISTRRALNKFASEVRKHDRVLGTLMDTDRKYRQVETRRRGIERALDILRAQMGDQDYLGSVGQATALLRRRADQVIQAATPAPGVEPGTIVVTMPPNAAGERRPRQIVMSFEKGLTDAGRAETQSIVDDIGTWMATNHATADPVMFESYRFASEYLQHLLNPHYAISDSTIDQAGLWHALGAPLRLPIIRNFVHPVLREIDDEVKGQAKGLLTRAMASFVRWGTFEQGLRPDIVRIKAALRDGLKSHGLVAQMGVRQLFNPNRLDNDLEHYRWLVVEPIIRSRQNALEFQVEPGMKLPDVHRQIDPSGWITVTKADIAAVDAQAEYERKVRDHVSGELASLDEGSSEQLRVSETTPSGQQRSRLPFASGPATMSRSFAEKSSGPLMEQFLSIRRGLPMSATSTGAVKLDDLALDRLRQRYVDEVLSGRASGGNTDPDVWQDIILSYVLETNPELTLRSESGQRKVYDSIARDIYTGKFQPTSWNQLVREVALRRQTLLGDGRTFAERAVEAERLLGRELTQSMENLHQIQSERSAGRFADVAVMAPKSSFTTARGHMVAPPGLYEHGLTSDFAINALHGSVLRHLTNNLMHAMEVVGGADGMLKRYIDRWSVSPSMTRTIAGRKASGEAAYKVSEAIRLQKAIQNQLSVMRQFEEATRDPEQYYHDVMRWGTMFFVAPLVSAAVNPLSVMKDTYLTLSTNILRQRQTLWGITNWMFTSPKALMAWLSQAKTMALASFSSTASGRRTLKQALVNMIPPLARAVHDASRRMHEMRLAGAVRGISYNDELALMRTSGSLFGIMGAQEWERTRPLVSRIIKGIDRLATVMPLPTKTLTYLVRESRTIAEDLNAMTFAKFAMDDMEELKRRAIEAMKTREARAPLVTNPNDPAYPLTPDEMGMSLGGMRQARRWMEGTPGLEAVILRHLQANPGKSAEELMDIALPQEVVSAWMQQYLTESQVQTLRERPAVAFSKGLTGRVARSFSALKVWGSANAYSLMRGEQQKIIGRRWWTKAPEELVRMAALLALLVAMGAPGGLLIDWLKDKSGRPQGLTIENILRNPDQQMALALLADVATQVIPLGGMLDEWWAGVGRGTFEAARLAPAIAGMLGVARSVQAVWRTSVWNDPKSWLDAASYQASQLLQRSLPGVAAMSGLVGEGVGDYRAAGAAVRKLAPSDIERAVGGADRVPSSPAYDNINRAVTMATGGNFQDAAAEVQEGLRQVVASGVEPKKAIEKLKSMISARSSWRSGLERTPTEVEKLQVMERATPQQQQAIVRREQAVRALAASLGGGGGGGISVGGFGGGQPVSVPRPKATAGALMRLLAQRPAVARRKVNVVRRLSRLRRSTRRPSAVERLRGRGVLA